MRECEAVAGDAAHVDLHRIHNVGLGGAVGFVGGLLSLSLSRRKAMVLDVGPGLSVCVGVLV